MNDKRNEFKNNSIIALDKFRSSLGFSNNDELYLKFLARVFYFYKKNGQKHCEVEKLNVALNFYNRGYGRINIEDGERIISNKFLLNFSPELQVFTHAKKGHFIINGISKKLGGKFMVEIME